MTHNEKVRRVAEQVKVKASAGEPLRKEKDGVSHFVPNPYEDPHAAKRIDLRDLNEILEIDAENLFCVCEPGVTFDALATATLAKGVLPLVVPELKGITVGGAVAGCSVEGMSYKVGGFHDNCTEYEIVTGTGEIQTCSPEKDADVFELIHGSYGTLAILTKLTFKLIPAKPFVKMTYRRFDNFDAFWTETLERCEVADFPFIDAIVHSPSNFTLCLGEMVDTAPHSSKYDRGNIFYKSTTTLSEDYLTTYDYCFRYDTECHWLTRTLPILEIKPVRLLVGKWFLGSTNLITWSNRLRKILGTVKRRPEVVVDVFIPADRMKTFFEWYETDFDFFPLWIVPYKMKEIYDWVDDDYKKRVGTNFLIDCAVYGKANNDKNVDYSELLEKKVYELGGVKTLISRNHYDRETFWKIYSKPRIEAMKQRLDPKGLFAELYEKFKPELYRK